jgi:hypothetical protein
MSGFGPLFQGDERADAAIGALVHALQQRHGDALRSLLFYGSCLRSGDLHEGLVDIYAVVDGYRHARLGHAAALANRLLPPNVYYLETSSGSGTVRCKYALFSEKALAHGVSAHCLESYLWGRLCQPVAVAWAADETALATARAVLHQATVTFLDEALPLAEEKGYVSDIWATGLAHSYATELRSEPPDRAAAIAKQSASYLAGATAFVAAELRWPLRVGGEFFTCVIPCADRVRAARRWARRRIQGKCMSVLRLLKALFTFDGGLDYIAWKLERHTGRAVVIPERVRRFPLLFVWGFMWQLRREGFFR